MGIILNWNSGYTGSSGSIDDKVTNFPTVVDGTHDVMASHVNSLADAVIELETIQTSLMPLEILDEGATLSSGASSIDFVGAGVTATNVGDDITVTVSGDVSGPGSATDNAVVRFDGTSGDVIQESLAILDDGGNFTGVGTINNVDITSHALRHISGGSDELDGDILDIDFTPTNYTPSTSPPEVTLADHLTAHLAGIDDSIGSTDLHTAYVNGDTITLATATPITVNAPDPGDLIFDLVGPSTSTRIFTNHTETLRYIAASQTAAAPSFTFSASNDIGMFLPSSDTLGFSTEGILSLTTKSSLTDASGDEIATELTPTINKATSGNYTALRVNANVVSAPGTNNTLLSLDVGGSSQAYITDSGKYISADSSSSSSSPSFTFNSDQSTGIYQPSSNQLGLSANSEGVILDNDSSTPSMRGDVDAVWNLGEQSLRWNYIFQRIKVVDSIGSPTQASFEITDIVSTSNAVTANFLNTTLEDDHSYWVEAFVVGVDVATGDSVAYCLRSLVYRYGGSSATQQGTTDQAWVEELLTSCDATIKVTSNDVYVEVLGNDSTNMNWSGTMRFQAVGAA